MPIERDLKAICRCEHGNVAIMMALMATSLLAFMGAAVDFGRWLNARSVTMSGLDAAVLAAGRSLQIDPSDKQAAIAIAERYYATNVAQRLQLISDTVNFNVNQAGTQVIARGNAAIKTPLLGFAAVSQLPLFTGSNAELATAEITAGGGGSSNLEVSVMLDVTGSMCDDGVGPCLTGSKITALKNAVTDLVNIVVSPDQSKYISRVALVPFSTRVRVGQDGSGGAMMTKLTNLPATWTGWYEICTAWSGSGGSESNGNWTCTASTIQKQTNWPIMPCVTDRYYDATSTFDATDDVPASGKWLNAHGGDRMVASWDSSNTAATNHLGANSGDPAWHWNYSPWGCADIMPSNEVMPLSSDKTALIARVNGLEAYGSTGGALGTAWAWYMLSPNWSSVWNSGVSSSGNTPAPYADVTTLQSNGSPKLRKVAVLMTDGGYNTYRGWKDQDQQQVSNYAKSLCTNMKAQGVEVYTVGFALNELSASEYAIAVDTLKSCGTDVQHFYETLNAQQLQQAFRDIALKMSSLHLTK